MRKVLDSKASESPFFTSNNNPKPPKRWKRPIPIFLIIILFFILIISVVTLSILLITSKKQCKPIEIGEASRTISSLANFKADPCSDFYDYACGNFLKTAPKPPHMHNWNSFAWASDDVNHKLHELLVSDEKEVFGGRSKAVTGMKEYYRSCLKPPSSDLSPLIKVIRELGGWPLAGLEHPDLVWKSKTWSLQTGLNVAHLYQSFPLLLIRKGFISNPPMTVIRKPSLTLDHASIDKKLASSAFQQAVLFTLKILKGEKIEDEVDEKVKEQIESMWKFEKDLNKIMEGIDKTNIHTLTVKEADDIFKPILNLGLLLGAYYKIEVKPTQHLMLRDRYYFDRLKNTISKHSNQTIANYMVWSVLRSITTDVSTHFKSAKKILENLQRTPKKEAYRDEDYDDNDVNEMKMGRNDDDSEREEFVVDIPKWEKCLRETIDKFEFAIASSYVHRHINPSFKKDIQKLCENLVDFSMTNQPDFFDEETKKKSIIKLRKLKCRIAYPSFILNVTELDNYYQGYNGGSTHLQSSIRHRLFKSQIASRQYGKQHRWLASPVLLNAYFFHLRNELILFAGMQHAPLFYPNVPYEIKMGGLGTTLAHELTHSFLPPGLKFNGEGMKKDWWTDTTNSAYVAVEKCYVQAFDKNEMFNKSINGRLTVKENMADSGGLWLAFHQLLKMYGDDQTSWNKIGKKTTLPGINLTRAQVFFVTYAQKLCSVYDKKHSQYMFNRPHTFNNIRIQETIANSKEFARAFKCPSESTLNPSNKCHIF